MLNKITIIGVGLIGGSLALALKRAGAVKTVAGCGRESILRAKELGIIDEAFTDAAEAVRGAEVVVLCTPLSTYASITKQIAPHLAPGAILTDAGSVKALPAQEVLAALGPGQRPYFVPGHPIAGTEKSGPEAAFAELFEKRLCILTKLPETDKRAVERVRWMWEAAGARVSYDTPENHDKVYAHVSHNVQLFCSAYGVMLARNTGRPHPDPLPHAGEGDAFRRFIRLCGSDPVMWRDIFRYNRPNMLACMDDFLKRWKAWEVLVSNAAKTTLEDNFRRLLQARKSIEDQNLGGQQTAPTNREDIHLHLLPLLVSAVTMGGIDAKEYGAAIGGGLRGFTRNLLEYVAADAAAILRHKEEVLAGMASYAAALGEFRTAIAAGDHAGVEALMREGRKAY